MASTDYRTLLAWTCYKIVPSPVLGSGRKFDKGCFKHIFINLTKIILRLETFNRCLTIKWCFDKHFNIGMHITESQCEINCFF